MSVCAMKLRVGEMKELSKIGVACIGNSYYGAAHLKEMVQMHSLLTWTLHDLSFVLSSFKFLRRVCCSEWHYRHYFWRFVALLCFGYSFIYLECLVDTTNCKLIYIKLFYTYTYLSIVISYCLLNFICFFICFRNLRLLSS